MYKTFILRSQFFSMSRTFILPIELNKSIVQMSFLRFVGSRVILEARKLVVASKTQFHWHSHHNEPEDVTDSRYEDYFNRPDIDGWDVRQGMTDILGLDMVPDPKVIIAAMYACRRVNDYALAVRFLEAVKDKTGNRCAEIYPYIIQEIAPVICELGIDTPEVLGYDKPEFYLESVFDIH